MQYTGPTHWRDIDPKPETLQFLMMKMMVLLLGDFGIPSLLFGLSLLNLDLV